METKKCLDCGNEYDYSYNECPFCGSNKWTPVYKQEIHLEEWDDDTDLYFFGCT